MLTTALKDYHATVSALGGTVASGALFSNGESTDLHYGKFENSAHSVKK